MIARFDSLELREQLDEAVAKENEKARLADLYNQQLRSGSLDVETTAQLKRQANSAELEADRYMANVEQLTDQLNASQDQIAPRDGYVMGLPTQEDLGKQFDRNYQQNKPICLIGDPTQLLIQVPVSPADYRLLQDDLPQDGTIPVSIYVKGRTDQTFSGVIRRLPQSNAKQVPLPLTQRGGGPLAVRQSGERRRGSHSIGSGVLDRCRTDRSRRHHSPRYTGQGQGSLSMAHGLMVGGP